MENRDPEEKQNVDLTSLLDMTPSRTKQCAYPTCTAQIPYDAEFTYCDTCRTLAARNAVALVLDPIAPKELQRAAEVTSRLLLNMTGDEILQFHERIEKLYLEVCKMIKIHGISSTSKRAAKTLSEQVEEARSIQEKSSIRAKQQKKREKGKQSSAKRLSNLLGVDEKTAKRIMEDDFSSLS